MALTAASTLDAALDQLNNSLAYEEGGLVMARDYRDSLRWLLSNRALAQADASTSYSFERLESELKRVNEFIIVRDIARRQRFATGRMPR